MFGNLLGKKKDGKSKGDTQNKELLAKIAKMNLTEMRSYVNNKIPDLPVSEEGLNGLIATLCKPNENTSKLYLQDDDNDAKKRKAFELMLLIAKSQKITFKVIDGMQEFLKVYEHLIHNYDKENKDIYASRLATAIELSLKNIKEIANLKTKMNILGEN